MYTRCLFCQADLGANAALPSFAVGRRLAYDAARGRLWVVCTACGQWNLSPLDARWEAIEEAERLYRGTRLRIATDNVGMARVGEDTELVRIGRPLRPELAAWRWGDRFGERRRRLVRTGTAGAVGAVLGAGALVAAGAPLSLLLTLTGAGAYGAAMISLVGGRAALFTRRWIPDGDGSQLLLTPNELPSVRLAAGGPGGWTLKVPFKARRATTEPRWRDLVNEFHTDEALLHGEPALEAARRLLPMVNGNGAPAARVRDAVRTLDELAGEGGDLFGRATGRLREWSARQTSGDSGALLHLPAEARLALEMAAHEDRERRALEGELAELERAWQDAERIAAIADDLAIPDGVRARLARLKRPP
jgi:hypothetical protein